MRSASQIRQEFIDFFLQRGHAFVPSSPVVPHDDPTLLFTNAGMNQFKPYFLGLETARYRRVANTQKCIRAGGKHNDLDDVGHDTYHHTFFEMLGNWSFGDYFKREAIAWAWELLTGVWGLDKQRLHATYFQGDPQEGLEPDDEARDLWASVTDIDPSHIHPGSKKDNFWEMGDTGPCGPCSEIHIDLTPDRTGRELVNAGDPRVIEIWNLVFIQFNRGPDGRLTPLPAKHVDTGMGFERITTLLQKKASNYDTDLFVPIIEAIRDVTGAPAYQGRLETDASAVSRAEVLRDVAYRVVADHIRCLTFAITDGAFPDREGRGFVLRRILRRAVRYGWQYLGMHEPFLYRLVPVVVDVMGDAFPELKSSPQEVAQVIREEEESFGRTLDRGLALFEEAAEQAVRKHHGRIAGADAFRLHDTFGFPIDLTQIMAAERGLTVDIGEYERLMEEARQRARAGARGTALRPAEWPAEVLSRLSATDDSHKYQTMILDARLTAALRLSDGTVTLVEPPEELREGESAALVLDRTCCYAEQGGQVGDRGEILSGDGRARFEILDTQRAGEAVLHIGAVRSGTFCRGQAVRVLVDQRRSLTRKNHTATHLLNWALREVLGDHVQQKGSLVDPDKTRFDFSHPRAVQPEELERVEELVNQRVAANLPMYSRVVPQKQALRINGLRAVFGEKYPEEVRVCCIGMPVEKLLEDPENPRWREYSIEFCGGTHLEATGQIGRFAIVAEEAVAKGVRRIVAVTGPTALRVEAEGRALLKEAEQLKSQPPQRIAKCLPEFQRRVAETTLSVRDRLRLRHCLAELAELVQKQQKRDAADAEGLLGRKVNELLAGAEKLGGTTVVVAEMPDFPVEQLKHGADLIKRKCGSAAVLFGVRRADGETDSPTASGKAFLLAAMTPDLVRKGVRADELVKALAPIIEGGGGGPPTMAQAGGKNGSKLAAALAAGQQWLRQRLS